MHCSGAVGQTAPSGSCFHRFTSWVEITPTRLSSCQEPKSLRLLPAPWRMRSSVNGSHEVHTPATANVRPRSAQMAEKIGLVATGLFQSVGQDGETGRIEGA